MTAATVTGRELVPADARIVYLGPDMTDAATFRRCDAWHRLDVPLTSFTFERRAGTTARRPNWRHVSLGPLPYGVGRRRLRALAHARRLLGAHVETFAAATIVWARNLDLGLLARAHVRSDAPLVYEVLDVHPLLLRPDLVGGACRRLERQLLRRVDLVVVSSPAFAREYFDVYTDYRGPVRILENKIGAPLDTFDAATLAAARGRSPGSTPLRLGIVGRLRCRRSLELLEHLLCRSRRALEVHVFGYPEAHVAERFDVLRRRDDRLIWHGRFAYPEELPDVYGRIDLNWCIAVEPHQPQNARWLLPNRIYEGGLFAVPAIALRHSETGRWIDDIGGGWLVDADDPDALVATIDALDDDALGTTRAHLATRPRERFMDGFLDHARLLAELADGRIVRADRRPR